MDLLPSVREAIKDIVLNDSQKARIERLNGEIAELLRQNAALTEQLAECREGALPTCPFCGKRTWALVSERKETGPFADLGRMLETHHCTICGRQRETLAKR